MSERNFAINTSYGDVEVTLREMGGKTVGAVTFPDELQPRFAEAETFDHMVDALSTMVLAHACAGVDVQAPAYVKGLNDALVHVVYNGD